MKRLLESQTVRLRAPEPADVGFLYELENDPDLWSVSDNSAPYSLHQLRRYIEESAHDYFTDRQVRFIIESIDGADVVGTIDLTQIDNLHLRAQVGVAVLQRYRGRGYASAALDLISEYACKTLYMNQLYAVVPGTNEVSLRLFRKAGFQITGNALRWLRKEDGYEDAVLLQKLF